jgi:hypothetical protein
MQMKFFSEPLSLAAKRLLYETLIFTAFGRPPQTHQ